MEEGSVNNNLEELFLIQRKDTKLTLRHLPGPFSVTNGTNTKAYSYASQTFTMKLFCKHGQQFVNSVETLETINRVNDKIT